VSDPTRRSEAGERTFLRPADGRILGGVCAALSRKLGVDAVVVRGVFLFLALFFGLGIFLYLVLWLTIPEE
jgi:phage shock protein PspC (stress-responsive transcriptional regulator)